MNMNIITKLDNLVTKYKMDIDQWFKSKSQGYPPLFYYSVDIRHSKDKLAPVDTNIYPAGFNNIPLSLMSHASELCKNYLSEYFPQVKTIAIIGENHTRNKFYLKNLVNLAKIIGDAGFRVICGNTNNENLEFPELKIKLQNLRKDGQNLFDQYDNKIDLIILNNDLTSGVPDILQHISIPIIPHVNLGWFNRTKSNHFACYQKLAEEFGNDFDLNSVYFTTAFASCGMVNFRNKEGLECIAKKAERLLEEISKNYQAHNISQNPYLFIKANRGTYGMGIMAIQKSSDILNINKNDRHSMSMVKGGTPNTDVIIQEGVETIDLHNNHTAESMVYGIAGQPLELLYRVHSTKDNKSNLNSVGMHFINSTSNDFELYNQQKQNACYLIARLSAAACLFEL